MSAFQTGDISLEKIVEFFQHMKIMAADVKRVCICNLDEITVVHASEIVRCESKKNYTTVYLKNGTKHLATKTLGEFEAILAEYDFFRIHHSILLNLAFVKSFKKSGGGFALLTDGTQVVVSARRREEFIKRLKDI